VLILPKGNTLVSVSAPTKVFSFSSKVLGEDISAIFIPEAGISLNLT